MTPEQRAHRDFFRKHSEPTADKPWFSYSPDGDFLFFSTEEEAKEHAEGEIPDYCQDTWDEEVEGVLVGRVSLVATQTDLQHRPPEDQLDDDGCDEDGNYWDDGVDYRCDYKLLPLASETEKAAEQQDESPVDALMKKVECLITTYVSARTDESNGALLEGLQGLEDAKELYSELREELEALL